MAYQVPKANHPWRQYQKTAAEKEAREEKTGKPLRVVIAELSQSWDNIEVNTGLYGREGRYSLTDMPQSKQAMWLISFIRRNFCSYE